MAKSNRMDKEQQGITKLPGTAAGAGFLQKYAEEDQSLMGMEQFMTVPRLKILQQMSDPDLKKRFGEGAVIIRPGDALVAKDDTTPFLFVPQLFFVEYAKWSDRRDKESPAILERSYDPTSNVAKRCGDKDQRYETYQGHESRPEKDRWSYRYVQHFCFPGVIYGEHPLADIPVVLSFERGEYGQGRKFIGAIKMRRAQGEAGQQPVRVPLWAQVWELKPALRQGQDGNWYGFDYGAPTQEGVSPVIRDDEADKFHAAHVHLKEMHEANKLRVDHADGDDQGAPGDPNAVQGDGQVREGDAM